MFSLCIGLAILATAALPKWLGWISVAIGIVAFTPVGFFGFFATLIWSAIVAVLVYRRSAPSGPPVAAAA